MMPTVFFVLVLLATGGAEASRAFRSTDARGRSVYTDKPEVLPEERLNIKSRSTDAMEVQQRYDEDMKHCSEADTASRQAASKAAGSREATQLPAEGRARRCAEARARHEAYQTAQRMYEPGASEGERRYLSGQELEVAKANARKVMEESCSGL